MYLNDSPAGAALLEGQKVIRQSDGLAQPVEHDGLQLGAGGTGRPGEADAPDAVAQHVAQDRGERVARREVGVEARMLPVRHAGHDLVLHVAHDLVPVLRLLWRLGCSSGSGGEARSFSFWGDYALLGSRCRR